MKHLNQKATKVFNKLIKDITQYGDGKKIDNSNGTYMPVSVHLLYPSSLGKVYSVTHYYEQNGDLMSDPDIEFILGKDGNVYPMTYRQDALGIMQIAVEFKDGKTLLRANTQKDITTFANQWMSNIKQQQGV